MKHLIERQNTAADNIRDKSSITSYKIQIFYYVKSKRKNNVCSEFNHNRTQKYIEILKNYLRSSLAWCFGNHTAIFQKDNASCHALRILREYLDKNDMFTLYWPPQSPDLNIKENIWHVITS